MNGPVVRLKDLCSLITKGTTPTSIGFDFSDEGVGFLRVQNVSGGRVNFQNGTLFIEESVHQELRRSQILPGDILLSIAGTIGRTGVVPAHAPALNCNQALAIIRPEDKVFRPFLRHWLESDNAQSQMRGATVTGTIQNLSLAQVGGLQVPLPPLPEQRRIAAILDQADALRAKRREALAQLGSLTQSIFIEMFGDPTLNKRGWPIKTLKELGKVTTGGTPPSSMTGMFGGSIPFVTPGDLESEDPVRRTVTEGGALQAGTVRAGATFVCCIGATIGKMNKALVRSSFNQQLNAVEWNHQHIQDEFGLEVLRFFKPTIVAWGASTTLPILKKSSFEKIEVPVPPVEMQQKFCEIVASVAQTRRHYKRHAIEADALFNSLQSRAFTGVL